MANLKVLRRRIRSITNTKQITKAMKMVSAAKLRRAQEQAYGPRHYSQRMSQMIHHLASRQSAGEGGNELLFGRTGEGNNKVELVVFTSDRGLCGSFNSSVVRAVRAKALELQGSGFQVSLTCVGRKGYDILKRQFPIRKVHTQMGRGLTFDKVRAQVADELVSAFTEGKFDICYLVFNAFKSAMSQILTWKQVMPIPAPEQTDDEAAASYLFEPEEEEILDDLLTRNITVQVYQALVESEASEQGARMTAMDNASRNAQDMIRKLTILYNRNRQAAITGELMEIIGGAESLKG